MIYLITAILLCITPALSQVRECTEEDWVSKYTECTTTTNLRDLIYYKNPDTDECSGGVSMPEHVFNLPCDIACEPGYYLPRGARECLQCPAGQYTLGGATVIKKWANESQDPELPFRTYATDKGGATVNNTDFGWYTDPGRIYLRSGKIPHSHTSVLELTSHLVTDGKIQFNYIVDSEQTYDYLLFSINGEDYLKASNEQFLQTFTQELTRGYYTFTWKYVKDFSFSTGSDAAYIQHLEIVGTHYADEGCLKCSAGTYSSAAASSTCTSCPMNTYSGEDGATECTPCSDDTYAVVGSTECTERMNCTEDDYISYYTECRVSEDGKFVRDLIYEWPEYTKCDYLSEEAKSLIPANQYNIECDACNPGMERNRTTGKCVFCGFDAYSDGTSECKSCGSGTRANYGIYINKWSEQSTLDMFTTNCSGRCYEKANGWQLGGEYVTSGVNNGQTFVTTLELIFNATERTKLTVGYWIHKSTDSVECALVYNDVGIMSRTLYRSYTDETKILNETFDISEGHHHVRFIFTSVTKSTNDTNYANIHFINIPNAFIVETATTNGVTGGNACASCEQGTYSTGGMGTCDLCEPGTSSGEGASNCTMCPENTFNDVPGGLCRSCGNNVETPAGSLQCPLDCFYTPDNNKTFYDIRSLFKNDMYGPVYDGTGFQYFINICSLKHSNVSCIDGDGNSIDALACQVLNNCPAEETCTGKNLGMVAGYYPIDPAISTHGFVLEYTGGDFGCDTEYRSTNITFICTPDAGVGFPAKPDEKETIEGPWCHYDFYWRSLYGCPVCTENDYSFYYTECKDNKRTKIYYWNENPRACHDGVELPPNEEVPTNCTAETICPPGEYADGTTGECAVCPAGKFSVGAGSYYDNFEDVPSVFTNKCTGSSGCTPFRARNGYLISGYGYDSTLRYTSTFIAEGSVTFEYSAYLPSSETVKYTYGSDIDSDAKPHFEFSVDDEVVLNVTTRSTYSYDTFTHKLSSGGHILQWRFVRPDSRRVDSEDFAAVELHTVTILGDKYSSTSCSSCPPGTFMAESGGSLCTPCPSGSIAAAPSGASKCVACAADEYTYDGITCHKRVACTAADWNLVYGACVNGLVTREWTLAHPSVCDSSSYTPAALENATVECEPCPVGMSRDANNSGECVGCPEGKVYNESLKECVVPASGHAAIYNKVFFGESARMGKTLPAGWSTSGLGWRQREGFVDSGVVPVTSSEVKSILTYNGEIVIPLGSLSFEIACTVRNDRNVFLFLNDDRVMLNFIDDYNSFRDINNNDIVNNDDDNTPIVNNVDVVVDNDDVHWYKFNVDLPRGSVNLAWLTYYASSSTTTSNEARFYLRNVQISGLKNGESVDYECPAGYEAAKDQLSCEPCAAGSANPRAGGTCSVCFSGQFSRFEGSTHCKKCYAGSSSTAGSTSCSTSCSFTSENASYDLSPFSIETQGPFRSTDGSSIYMSICTGKFPKGICGSTGNASSGFHICRVAPNGVDYVNFGTNLMFTQKSDMNISLDFFDGDEVYVDGTSVSRSTHIDFVCNVNVGTGYPILKFANESHLDFTWTTYFACRSCVSSDYVRIESKCEGGYKQFSTSKKEGVACYGEYMTPGISEKCSAMTVPIYVPIIAAIVLITLIAIIVLAVYRNRVVTTKYQNLKLANPLLADGDAQIMDDVSNDDNNENDGDRSTSIIN